MKVLRTTIVFPGILLALAPFAFGASKEMQELQRDVALLQDQVRTMQRTQDEKFAAMQALVQQTLESVNRTNTAVAVMENKVNEALKAQQQLAGGAVANVGQKLDQMAEDFRAVRESVLDMNTRMGKLDAKMADLQNLINAVQRPAPPPPGTSQGDMGNGLTTQVPTGPPAGMQAGTTYTNAYRDYKGGKYDLALQEFNDYLKYFPKTDFAPNAQFYLGDIYYRKGDYENAVPAFDALLEQYSENAKTADAHYMKGMSLRKMERRDAAAKEFREVVSKYPDSEVAANAREQLKMMGLSAGGAKRTRR
ncbi:MAG TPA: tol-pal system protein YbgF [Bryobacteraceae bacterium]|nr:tol-pal system protein YbgF [Bryobacteraceae bacterium]